MAEVQSKQELAVAPAGPPESATDNFDIGLVGSSGLSEGWNIGVSNLWGFSNGNEQDLKGIPVNVTAGGSLGSATVSFNQDGVAAIQVGPATDLGASIVLSKTEAVGLNDFGYWLGGKIYDLLHLQSEPPACHK